MAPVESDKNSLLETPTMINSDEWKDLIVSKVIDESRFDLMKIKS